MRKLFAALLAAAAVTGPTLAADMPYYPPIVDVPDVNYGVQGSFYLRGSVGLNALWAKEVNHPSVTPNVFAIDGNGTGYSYGVGAGYETGTGLRFDLTVDRLHNDGMSATVGAGAVGATPGSHKLSLRSTVVLANAYYDFGFGDGGYGAAGGAFGYVGAGAGIAFNDVITNGPPGAPADQRGYNSSLAAAGMIGVGYDFGSVVADIGYRALYINKVENSTTVAPYSIANNWAHEVRGTLRYRFN